MWRIDNETTKIRSSLRFKILCMCYHIYIMAMLGQWLAAFGWVSNEPKTVPEYAIDYKACSCHTSGCCAEWDKRNIKKPNGALSKVSSIMQSKSREVRISVSNSCGQLWYPLFNGTPIQRNTGINKSSSAVLPLIC